MTWNNDQPLSAYFWISLVLFVTWIVLIVYCFQRNLRRVHSQNSIIDQLQQVHSTAFVHLSNARNSITANGVAVTRILQVRKISGQR